MSAVAVEYDAKLDAKKRIVIRDALYEYYHVSVLPTGRIILDPRELVPPFEVSANTLAMMDQSMKNYKEGKVSEAIDLSEFGE